MKFCPKCSVKLHPSAKICSNCQHNLSQSVSSNAKTTTNSRTYASRNQRTRLNEMPQKTQNKSYTSRNQNVESIVPIDNEYTQRRQSQNTVNIQKIICPECNGENVANARFCNICGFCFNSDNRNKSFNPRNQNYNPQQPNINITYQQPAQQQPIQQPYIHIPAKTESYIQTSDVMKRGDDISTTFGRSFGGKVGSWTGSTIGCILSVIIVIVVIAIIVALASSGFR